MRATVLYAPGDVRVGDVPDPVICQPTDALVRVVASCVCGSDLWPYRGLPAPAQPSRIGHEFVGVVAEVGAEVRAIRPGDFVVAPFMYCDNCCAHCRNGVTSSCSNGGGWGRPDRSGQMVDGGQGQYVRVPLADGTLVATPEPPDDRQIPDLLSLSDVMGTGHHAAVSAQVGPGTSVVVAGDGAVGICAVRAARRLGAERVVMMSRHAARQQLALKAGATDVVEQRGPDGAEAVRELFDGIGPDAALECVGTKESMEQALQSVRPGGRVGYVGIPHGSELPVDGLFWRNVHIAGGPAPIRTYLPELMAEVLDGRLTPGSVFDYDVPLAQVAEAYAAMDTRRAVKALLRP